MSETPQQYTQRILANLGGETPDKVRASSAKKLEKLMTGVSPAKLAKRPAPDKWSVAEVVAHLADAEVAMSWRVRAILGAPGCAIEAFDQDAWASSMNYAKRNPKQSLAAFRALRENNIALLKSLRREQFEVYCIHSERGTETIAKIADMMAGHDLNHIRQIEAILKPAKKASNRKR
jgi:DinB superfamily